MAGFFHSKLLGEDDEDAFGGFYGGGFAPPFRGRGLAPGAGSGLPFLAGYAPGVSGMRMVGTGGMPGYGGMTTQQIFSR